MVIYINGHLHNSPIRPITLSPNAFTTTALIYVTANSNAYISRG